MKPSAAEKRRRAARKRYWTRRIEDAKEKATLPWEEAAELAWAALSYRKFASDPDSWRPNRPCPKAHRTALTALWWLLADPLSRTDEMIRVEYEPGIEKCLNDTIPLYSAILRQAGKRKGRKGR